MVVEMSLQTASMVNPAFLQVPLKVPWSEDSDSAEDSIRSAYVSTESTVQIAQSVFLPCPANLETVPQPMKAWEFAYAGSGQCACGGLPSTGDTCQLRAITTINPQVSLCLCYVERNYSTTLACLEQSHHIVHSTRY